MTEKHTELLDKVVAAGVIHSTLWGFPQLSEKVQSPMLHPAGMNIL